MPASRRYARRVRLLRLRTLRAGRQHWLSGISLFLLGAAAWLSLAGNGEESIETRAQAEAAEPAVTATPVPPEPTATPRVTPPNKQVTFFLVRSEAHRDNVAAAVRGDSLERISGPGVTEYAVYLLAGTPEEESRAILRINFETELAHEDRVDIRVVDLR